jgi:sulfoxide reductase heme-binding subunit YedZ
MEWIRKQLLLLILNLLALIIFFSLLWLCFVSEGAFRNYSATLVLSGKWAIRFLLFSLLMTPLNVLLGWRSAITLRRPAGLWAFIFAALHFSIYLSKMKLFWFDRPITGINTALGFVAFCILATLALTSMRDSMKRLGKWWKPLHRLIYAAVPIAIAHAMLESSNTRVLEYDPDVLVEAAIYLGVLCLLLMVRVRGVRSLSANVTRKR